jgi:hypothetical protein
MTFAPLIIAAAVLFAEGVYTPTGQSSPAVPIPVRLSWGALNPDGYAQATLINDSPLIVTAWAVSGVITRPDGTTAVRSLMQVDAIGMLANMRSRPTPAVPAGPMLLPGKKTIHAVRVDDPAKVSQFSMSVEAVVLEDGTVLGNRKALARMLAQREVDATAASQWLAAFEAAAGTADRDAAASQLQQAVDSLPADRLSVTLKSIAQRAIGQRRNKSAFRAAVADAIKTARIYVIECRRHVTER